MHYEKITNPPISYNSAKKLYEITDTGAAIDILIAKNAAYF